MYVFISDLEKIKSYIDSFRYGISPHGGGGIGEEYTKFAVNLLREALSYTRDSAQPAQLPLVNNSVVEHLSREQFHWFESHLRQLIF